MKQIQITENIPNAETRTYVVSDEIYQRLVEFQDFGGFQRYSISMVDDNCELPKSNYLELGIYIGNILRH